MATDGQLTMACLGRPFQPGMLYDCRTDEVVAAVTLWNPDKLKEQLISQSKTSSNSELIMDDTMKEKSTKLNLEGSLKLSLLCGLLSVEGSAKYLNDKKKSNKQQRVSLTYSTTSRYDSLSMKHMGTGDIQYPEVFEKNNATHVVVAVEYGAEAVFVFDQTTDNDEESTNTEGSLKVLVKSIKFSVDGEGKGNLTDSEKEQGNKISCKFYGDFHLNRSPSTLTEAMETYRELPSIIKQSEPVPKKVWLYPLAKLEPKAAKLVREIDDRLVMDTETIVDELHKAETKVNDILQSCHPMFQGPIKQATEFHKMLTQFRTNFGSRLRAILPQIRGGGESEEKLAQLLDEVNSSSFAPNLLQHWADEKQSEVTKLNNIIKQLKNKLTSGNVTIATKRDDASDVLGNFDFKFVLVLVFYVSGKADMFMNQLKAQLRAAGSRMSNDQEEEEQEGHQWSPSLRKKALAFMKFAEANQNNNSLKFLVHAEETKDGELSAKIMLHHVPDETKREFTLPTTPGKPTIRIEENPNEPGKPIVELQWDNPEEGFDNVTFFKVQYLVHSPELDWTKSDYYQTLNPENKAVIHGLKQGEAYVFRVCCSCDAGDGEFGEMSIPVAIGEPNTPELGDLKVTEAEEETAPVKDTRQKPDTWVKVKHGSPFPADAVKALDRELKGGDATTQNSFVAVWYDMRGVAKFGRVNNNNGVVAGCFPRGTMLFWPNYTTWTSVERSTNDGADTLILTNPGNEIVYRWVHPSELSDPRNHLISIDDFCPAVVSVSGRELLGMASPSHSVAWTTYSGKRFYHSGADYDQCFVLVRDA